MRLVRGPHHGLKARTTGWCAFGGYRNPAAKKRAIVAIAHTLAVITWHVLTTGTAYTDLGPGFYATRSDPAKETQRLITKLEALGHKVTLAPAA